MAYRWVPAPSFTALREKPRTFVVVSLVVGVIGLFMGPAIMTPAYRVLQPALGGMTLTAVEMLFAFLIDFPLATLASLVICRVIHARRPADGALAGAFFLTVFIALIGVCLLLGPVSSLVNVLALGEVFPPAVASASAALGQGTLGLLAVMFVLFDLVLCTLGGVAGYFWSTLFGREPRDRAASPGGVPQQGQDLSRVDEPGRLDLRAAP
jgi:hypothetical protein